jgi:hypothetical protein
MTTPGCDQLSFDDLVDYASGERDASAAAGIEAHLFACDDCGRRAAAVDELVSALRPAVLTGTVGGFVTDGVLNRLAREGIRTRTFTLSPGATVHGAVWQDDELVVLRLRGDFEGVGEITLIARVDGAELIRASGDIGTLPYGEVLHVIPAAMVRQLPVVDVEIELTMQQAGAERRIGTYRLAHGGSLQR